MDAITFGLGKIPASVPTQRCGCACHDDRGEARPVATDAVFGWRPRDPIPVVMAICGECAANFIRDATKDLGPPKLDTLGHIIDERRTNANPGPGRGS